MDATTTPSRQSDRSITIGRLGEVNLVTVRGGGGRDEYRRTAAQCRDAPDMYMMVVSKSGNFSFSHPDGVDAIGPSQAIFSDAYQTSTFGAVGDRLNPSETFSLVLPGHLVRPCLCDRERPSSGAVDAQSAAGRLLIGYLELAIRSPPTADEATGRLVRRHLADLFVSATQSIRSGADVELRGGRRAARLRLAMDYILHHLGDVDLNAGRVGRHLAISARRLQIHFEAEGMTFSGFVLEQRLWRMLRDLRDPRCAAMTIAEIAFAAGFGDLSHFNRHIPRRFGDTPSGVRSAGRQG